MSPDKYSGKEVGQGCSSVVESLNGICKTLGSIPSIIWGEKKEEVNVQGR
jgi:hypothetical protein